MLVVKNLPPCLPRQETWDTGLILGLGRSPGVGNGNPLQYSCLENPMDRGVWWATVHRIAKSWTWLNDWAYTHTAYISLSEWVSEVTQSCPTLCDPIDYIPPGSSIHGILQARILEWVAISYSRGPSPPRDRTHSSCHAFCIVGGIFTTVPLGSILFITP